MKEIVDVITASEEGHELIVFEQPHSRAGKILILQLVDPNGDLVSEIRSVDMLFIMEVMRKIFEEYGNSEELERINFAISEILEVYNKNGIKKTAIWSHSFVH